MQQGPAQAAGMIGGLLCGLLVFLPIAALISAVILRAACSLFNKLAGADRAVPEPGFGKAMGIVAATFGLNLVVGLGVGLIVGIAGDLAHLGPGPTQLLSCVVSLPISILATAGIIAGMLPTSFQRGLLVALIHLGIAIVIGIVIGIVVLVVVLALGVGFGGAGR